MSKRKSIPDAVVASVLVKCKRRCCFCSFWHDDLEVKSGQIAHIDRNSANAAEDNLAYLCFDHHNMYDSRQSQGKNLTPLELRHALEDLHQKVRASPTSTYSVTIDLNEEFGTLTDSRRDQVLSTLQVRESEISLVTKEPGVVILVLKLRADEMQKFIDILETDEVDELGMRIREISPSPTPADGLSFGGSYVLGIQEHVVPRSQVFEVVRRPDAVQNIRGGHDESCENSVCSIFAKNFGKKRNEYTCITLTYNLTSPMELFCAFRVYNSEVPHSAGSGPLEILRAFLDIYGLDLTAPGVGPVRLAQDLYVPAPSWVHSKADMDIALRETLQAVTPDDNIGWIDATLCYEYLTVMAGARVEMAFHLERRKYGLDVRKHKVNVPMQLIPTSKEARRDGTP